jgi:hypothetical protein
MGVVYQARHKEMDRQVVIKVINRALLDRPDSLERFRREIRAAAQLSHPNIVTAYDAEQAGESHMLVMEFVPGHSLAEVLHKKGPLPVPFACNFARQVAWGCVVLFRRLRRRGGSSLSASGPSGDLWPFLAVAALWPLYLREKA